MKPDIRVIIGSDIVEEHYHLLDYNSAIRLHILQDMAEEVKEELELCFGANAEVELKTGVEFMQGEETDVIVYRYEDDQDLMCEQVMAVVEETCMAVLEDSEYISELVGSWYDVEHDQDIDR